MIERVRGEDQIVVDGDMVLEEAGRLLISGQAPNLQFTWHLDDDVETAMSGPRWDWATVDANGTEPTPAPE